MSSTQVFDKVALALISPGMGLLLCRPYAYDDLILPGGVREFGESDTACLAREISEELGDDVTLEQTSLQFFGEFEDVAGGPAGDRGKRVRIRLYLGEVIGTPHASEEIRELVWLAPGAQEYSLTPILRNQIVPALIAARLFTDAPKQTQTQQIPTNASSTNRE